MAEPKIMATMPYDMTVGTMKITGGGGGDVSGGYTSFYHDTPVYDGAIGAFLTTLTVETMLTYLHTPLMLTVDSEQLVLTPVQEGTWVHIIEPDGYDAGVGFEDGHYLIFFTDADKYKGKTMDLSYANTGGIIPYDKLTITQNQSDINCYEYAMLDVNVPGIVPAGTKYITANGDGIDVSEYQYANVNVAGSANLKGTFTITNSSYSMQAHYVNANGKKTSISMSANGTYTIPLGYNTNDGNDEIYGYVYLNRQAGITVTPTGYGCNILPVGTSGYVLYINGPATPGVSYLTNGVTITKTSS